MSAYLENILEGISHVIAEFQGNPYQFLFESDIQFSMMSALRQSVNNSITIPGRNRAKYTVNCVNSEYYDRIDIACLDLATGATPPDTDTRNDTHIYNHRILVGIELKYVFMGYRKGFEVLISDFEKLTQNPKNKDNVENWLVLGFLQRRKEGKPFIEDARGSATLHKVERVALNGIYIVSEEEILRADIF